MDVNKFVKGKKYHLINEFGTGVRGFLTPRTKGEIMLQEKRIAIKFVKYTDDRLRGLLLTFEVLTGFHKGRVVDLTPFCATKVVS